MYKIARLISFIIPAFLFSAYGFAQKRGKVVIGKSEVRVEAHFNRNETEEMAIELAKVNAITDAFGQYVEQESTIDLEDGKVNFRSYGQTKVKGEWVRNIEEPIFEDFTRSENGKIELWINCKVKGLIRAALPKADVQLEILSCPKKNCRTTEFVNDQDMYLYVKSPIDGYLSVFLDDGSKVYRLLPYQKMGAQKNVKIKGDQDYILFSREHNYFDIPADRIELFTNRDKEQNTIIVVFSENEFNKPVLFDEQSDQENFIIPKSLSKNKFETWLGENRASFPDFLDIKRSIIIIKSE